MTIGHCYRKITACPLYALLVLLQNGGFCTAPSQNSVCITKGKCRKIIYFHNFSMIKNLKNKNCYILCHNLHNISFLMNIELVRAKSVLSCSYCRMHRYVATPIYFKPPFVRPFCVSTFLPVCQSEILLHGINDYPLKINLFSWRLYKCTVFKNVLN